SSSCLASSSRVGGLVSSVSMPKAVATLFMKAAWSSWAFFSAASRLAFSAATSPRMFSTSFSNFAGSKSPSNLGALALGSGWVGSAGSGLAGVAGAAGSGGVGAGSVGAGGVAGWVLGSAGVLPGWAGVVISVPPRAAGVGGDALLAPHGQDVNPEPNLMLHNQRQKGKITFDSKLGGVVDSQTITDAAERHPRAIRDLERRATHAASRPLAQALTDAQTAAL